MFAITSIYPQFFDTDGTPLEAGALYFGTANGNPETSPTTVYWDSAGTQPCAQPLTTSGGYIMRSGTRARVYASGDYALSVRNKAGTLVVYTATSAELTVALTGTTAGTGADMVGFSSGTTYAAGTVGEALKTAILTSGGTISGNLVVTGTLNVSGATTLAGLTAGSTVVSSLTSSGQVIVSTAGSPYYQSADLFGGGHTYAFGSGGSNFTSGTFGIVDSTAAATRWTIDSSGHMAPGADNTQNCGTAAKRWAVVYAGTGAINTSDARVKTPVQPLTNAEVCAAMALSREIGTFRFLDAVAVKGDRARLHIGMTVQRAVEIMTAHGLDAQQYGFICYDQWDADTVQTGPDTFETHGAPGDRWGFRVDELLLFIARGFDARLYALETKA